MPVVLKPDAWPVWLGEEPANLSALKALLTPFPSDEMACWPVGARVGNVKNNDATLIEPINAAAHSGAAVPAAHALLSA
jgi:putative SOS response-associated peptidase YedK